MRYLAFNFEFLDAVRLKGSRSSNLPRDCCNTSEFASGLFVPHGTASIFRARRGRRKGSVHRRFPNQHHHYHHRSPSLRKNQTVDWSDGPTDPRGCRQSPCTVAAVRSNFWIDALFSSSRLASTEIPHGWMSGPMLKGAQDLPGRTRRHEPSRCARSIWTHPTVRHLGRRATARPILFLSRMNEPIASR
jgi:hypothetical protein